MGGKLKWLALLLVLPSLTLADSIRFGGVSTHLSEKDYNSFHRFIGYEYRDWYAAYFRNSYYEDTFAVGKTVWKKETNGADIMLKVGLDYGYRKDSKCYKYQGMNNTSDRTFCPRTYLEFKLDLPYKPSIITGGNFFLLTFGVEL